MKFSFRKLPFLILLLATILIAPKQMWAQASYDEARDAFDNKNYQKAATLYEQLYKQSAENDEVYQDYLMVLITLKDYKQAENIAKTQLKKQSNNPLYMVDLGNIYLADKKEKKAEELFAQAITYINGDDIVTQKIANAFSKNGNNNWAIKSYERAIQVTQSPALYSAALARLYNLAGETEKAISISIESHQNMAQMFGDEPIEANLLEIIGNDPSKQKLAQKAIIKLVNGQPDNYFYSTLLIWIFSLQNNWDQALIQVKALEKRRSDKGGLLYEFAANALRKNEYEAAEKAYNTIIELGDTNPRYKMARVALLESKLQQIENSAEYNKSAIATLSKDFADYFAKYPDAFGNAIVNKYAYLLAQFADSVDQAISLLQKAIEQQIGNKFFIANCKLQLGDYYIIKGTVWEAALVYAQVDKAFREDALGEEARFRNAKLSYYQNDFEQAQGQLSVLKASTSELIANDALFLSVQITENVPPDSNLVPLQRFAFADLLLFQNKDKEAETLLDSIAAAFPKNPLADDILLLRSKIANKHKDYNKTISYLKEIIEKYGKDVLADDALFRISEIYHYKLKDLEAAKRNYEQLIIDYPGSSFVQQSRRVLKEMEPAL